jgi:hypothetical protein
VANKAYLGKHKAEGEKYEILFEERFVPLFWYCALSTEDVELAEKNLIRDYGTDRQSGRIPLKKFDLMLNLHWHEGFIERYYPDAVQMYNDFIRYLGDKIADGEVFFIDIIEMAWLTDGGMEAYLQELAEIVSSISWLPELDKKYRPYADIGQAFIYAGYDQDYNGNFSEYSEMYAQCVEDE